MPPTPIETTHAGHRFRSRLEARWAVALDTLGITWEYEPEAFTTTAGNYLPDFRLPALRTWLEIKPEPIDDPRHPAFAAELDHDWTFIVAAGNIPDPAALDNPERDTTPLEALLIRTGHPATAIQDAYQAARSARFEPASRNHGTTASHVRRFGERYVESIDRSAETHQPITPTGLRDLDELLSGGFRPAELIVISAQPAIGASTVAHYFARTCAIRNALPCYIATLDTTADEFTRRQIAAEARVLTWHLRADTLPEEAWKRIIDRTDGISAAPLYIDDTPDVDLDHIETTVTSLTELHGLRLAIIDPVQLVKPASQYGGREQQIADLAYGLKRLAKRCGITVIAVSRLEAPKAPRFDRRPGVDDFGKSCALVAEADVVILAHREDAYEPESPRAGEMDLIVAKHRNGRKATVVVAFQGHYGRIVEMDQS